MRNLAIVCAAVLILCTHPSNAKADGGNLSAFQALRDSADQNFNPPPSPRPKFIPLRGAYAGNSDPRQPIYCADQDPNCYAVPRAPLMRGNSPQGVFLNSLIDNRGLFFCSREGCNLLMENVREVIPSLDGGVFIKIFDSTTPNPDQPNGIKIDFDYCTPTSCISLLRGQNVMLPSSVGANGDLWAVSEAGVWHCSSESCDNIWNEPVDYPFNNPEYKSPNLFSFKSDSELMVCSVAHCEHVSSDCLATSACREKFIGVAASPISSPRVSNVRRREHSVVGTDGATYTIAPPEETPDPIPDTSDRHAGEIVRSKNGISSPEISILNPPLDCWTWHLDTVEYRVASHWHLECIFAGF